VTALVDQFYSDVQAMGGGRWDTSSLIKRLKQRTWTKRLGRLRPRGSATWCEPGRQCARMPLMRPCLDAAMLGCGHPCAALRSAFGPV